MLIIERLSVVEKYLVLHFPCCTMHDWLKNIAPLFHPIRIKPKPIATRSHSFSRALRQLLVIASNLDWFTGFSVSFVIGWSDYFDFGFCDNQLKTALIIIININ